jgi:hypothetical protein
MCYNAIRIEIEKGPASPLGFRVFGDNFCPHANIGVALADIPTTPPLLSY